MSDNDLETAGQQQCQAGILCCEKPTNNILKNY
jgi:hypothetical protein